MGLNNNLGKLAEVLTVSGSGRVGLNTTSPISRFHINCNVSDDYGLYINGENRNSISGNLGIGLTNPGEKLDVIGNIRAKYAANSSNISFEPDFAQVYLVASSADNTFGDKKMVINSSGLSLRAMGTSTAAMEITSGGNVGIGTTSPSAKLDIETSSGGYAVVIKNTLAGGDFLKMTGDSGNTVFEFGSGGTGGDGFLNMYADNSQKVLINADGNSYFNGGNVGMGTTSPAQKLHVVGAIRASGDYEQTGNNVFVNTSYDAYLQTDAAGAGIIFRTAGAAEKMRITSGGNVGIGNTNPQSLLHLTNSGGARIRVESGASTFSLLDFYFTFFMPLLYYYLFFLFFISLIVRFS
jgi:hypothetical protein